MVASNMFRFRKQTEAAINGMFPKSTDETFGQKFYQTFKNNKRYINPKLSCTNFTTFHYVGELTYLADLFLDKNQDYVLAVHQVLLTASKCPSVAGLLKSHLNHPLGHALRFKGDVSMCVYG